MNEWTHDWYHNKRTNLQTKELANERTNKRQQQTFQRESRACDWQKYQTTVIKESQVQKSYHVIRWSLGGHHVVILISGICASIFLNQKEG